MRFSLGAFEAAVTALLGSEVAQRVRSELGEASDTIEHSEAGRALVTAVFGPEVAEAKLRAVALSTDENAVILNPDVAVDHPLLAGWTAETPAEFASAAMLSGAALHCLAPSTPMFEGLRVTREGTAWEASAVLVFSNATAPAQASLQYGDTGTGVGLSVTTRLCGDTLFTLGSDTQTARHAPPLSLADLVQSAVREPAPVPTVH